MTRSRSGSRPAGLRQASSARRRVRRPARGTCLLLTALLLALGANSAWAFRTLSKQGKGAIVSGSAGLPDLKRGEQAAQEGRVAAAERDLVPLARSGYVDAQLVLGAMYEHEHTLPAARKGAYWLNKALPSAENPVQPIADLIRIYVDYPALDQRHRLPALARRAESLDVEKTNDALVDWYRHTPDIKGHRQRLEALCRSSLSRIPDCYVDLIRQARRNHDDNALKRYTHQALQGFADGAVPPGTVASIATALVQEMDVPTPDAKPTKTASAATATSPQPDSKATVVIPPGQGSCREQRVTVDANDDQPDGAASPASDARPGLANLALGKLIAATETDKVLAASVILQASYLVPDFDIESALRQAAADHVPQAALLLGRLYFEGDRATRQPQRALHYLKIAESESDTALVAHYFLGRLYLRGYLDQAQPVLAAKNLLYAARRGYGSADDVLARLFANGKGVCPDRVNAYVFATLGARDGSESTQALLKQLSTTLTPQQLARANTLLNRERQLRMHATVEYATRLNAGDNT